MYLKRVILAERSSEKVLAKLAALVLAKPLRVFRRPCRFKFNRKLCCRHQD
ncbi:hypothetical protein HMPREF9418_1749 [Neisseria macacae ATCC 33926]|uniref:Uncharacterized protein n=1 Tax=Neisseria macacae ATCC 33926 TaxID=997348 RepID=A0AA36UJ19_9NEIS|nr:hypothetical protein HMPREF9418_1749 [Neisseria macacae ATCC 33926]